MKEDLCQYIHHFGLIAKPFQDISDRRFVWLGDRQLENLAYLKVGIEENKGILLLLGDEGSGKSVLLDRLLNIIQGDLAVAILREPQSDAKQFYEFLVGAYGIQGSIVSKTDFLMSLKTFLLQAQASGRKVLLVVEDAQNQHDEILEQIRLLSNMEEKSEKLLSILLMGNPGLTARLSQHHHRALLQRVAVQCRAESLTEKETAAYIRHRMMVAGSFLEIFSAEAVAAIHRLSGGIPKLINLVCDHALMRGYHEKRRTIDGRMIADYAREIRKSFGLGSNGLTSAALERVNTARAAPAARRSFMLLPAALGLAALVLLAVGIPLIKFEEKPQVVGQPILPDPLSLYFEAGSMRLSTQDLPSLDRIAEAAIKTPQSRIFIKGYADLKGSAAQNMRISVERAEAARQYLIRKGVDSARIQAVGLGSQKPAGAGPSEDPKLSRRVEIKIFLQKEQ